MKPIYSIICQLSVNYVKNHFGSNTIIIFVGYETISNSVKNTKRLRRPSKASFVDIYFDEEIISPVKLLSIIKIKPD